MQAKHSTKATVYDQKRKPQSNVTITDIVDRGDYWQGKATIDGELVTVTKHKTFFNGWVIS